MRSWTPAPPICSIPSLGTILLAAAIDAERRIDGLVPHHPRAADLRSECIEDDYWSDAVERPLSPRDDLLHHLAHGGAERAWRNLDRVDRPVGELGETR